MGGAGGDGSGGGAAGVGTRSDAGSGGAVDTGAGGGTAKTTILVETTPFGDVIADGHGMTLYVFGSDTPAGSAGPISVCTVESATTWPPLYAGCPATWPPFYAATVTVPAALQVSDFGSFDRGGGNMQTTYKGWPLYGYIGDSGPRQTRGKGIAGIWFAAKVPFTAP